ncbi:lipopolysaccharide biosynthesis protein [Vibrio splendidus]|uniref:lipopolysaccharide biosynthesis protein n=1 Tax=Vibrio splendidus TaxID=29497 RepID=UPI00148C20AF|nr:oligosaccharide flippase family protein [Vibrio splendidus]NOJ10044.1 oligosaccharide flippase family protein [Vibrio splendidus]
MLPNSNSSIFRNILTLIAGSFFAKLIAVLSIPVITRIYSPEDMGGLSMFIAIVSILIPIATLRYNVAIPLPKSERQASSILQLCLLINLMFFLLLTVIIVFFNDEFNSLINFDFSFYILILIPVAVFGAGIYETFESYASRNKEFKLIAKTKIYQSVSGNFAKIFLGYMGAGVLGLVLGHVITLVGGLSKFYFKFKSHSDLLTLNRKFLVKVSKKYASFPIYRLPSQFILIFSGKAPLLFFGVYYSSYEAGQLGLSLMCLAFPISLIATSAGQAFYSEIAKLGKSNPSKTLDITRTLFLKMLLVGFIPTFILMYFSQNIFVIAFGEKWRDAGVFTEILSVYILFQFVSTPLVSVLNVYSKQKVFLILNLFKAFFIFCVFSTAFIFEFTAELTLSVYSIVMSVNYIFTTIFVFYIVKSKIGEVKS